MMIGVDLGGTKIEVALLDKGGKAVWRKRAPTPKGDYIATIDTIACLVDELKSRFSLSDDHPVGMGTPGATTNHSGQTLMKNCNSTVLNGRPFPSDLKARLGCEVMIANDANCFALAEARSGAAGEYLSANEGLVFGVILGTGVGGGIVVNGQALIGPNSIAGEWGHNPLPSSALNRLTEQEKSRSCYCGRNDCIETYLSGPGLSASYQLRYGVSVSAEQIVQRMREGESQAKTIWEQYLMQLAASLAQVINILDPDVVVLGGGLSQINEIYDVIQQKMKAYVFTDCFETPIVPASLGDSAGVYGAAWLTKSDDK